MNRRKLEFPYGAMKFLLDIRFGLIEGEKR
jgi:hypothetical protein